MVPSSHLGLHLTDCEFRCCLRYWLGVPLHSNSYPCPECGGSVDPFGITRLGVVAMAIESPATTPSEMSSLTPLNQLLYPLHGRLLAWYPVPSQDLLMFCSPIGAEASLLHLMFMSFPRCSSYITRTEASSSPSHVLRVGVQRKLTVHLSACQSAGVDFIPLVVESLRGLCSDAISNIRSISHTIGQRENSTESLLKYHQTPVRPPSDRLVAGQCQLLDSSPTNPPPFPRQFDLNLL